jgi:hypothetical protein
MRLCGEVWSERATQPAINEKLSANRSEVQILAHLYYIRKEERTLKISERLDDVLSTLDNLRDGIDDSLTTTTNILNNLKEFYETGLNELIENIGAIRDDARNLEIED